MILPSEVQMFWDLVTLVVYRIVWFDLKCLPSDVWSLEAKDQDVSSFCQEEAVVSALVEMRLVFLVIRFHPTHCAGKTSLCKKSGFHMKWLPLSLLWPKTLNDQIWPSPYCKSFCISEWFWRAKTFLVNWHLVIGLGRPSLQITCYPVFLDGVPNFVCKNRRKWVSKLIREQVAGLFTNHWNLAKPRYFTRV